MAARQYSPRPRRFVFERGRRHKFWDISLCGAVLHIRFGRIGTTGQSLIKLCADPAAAEREADRLIRSKMAKGYEHIP